jgi:hypothetical protein
VQGLGFRGLKVQELGLISMEVGIAAPYSDGAHQNWNVCLKFSDAPLDLGFRI